MAFIEFIKDCRRMRREYPYMTTRNLLYLNSQPKYLYGRIVDGCVRIYDKIHEKFSQKFWA